MISFQQSQVIFDNTSKRFSDSAMLIACLIGVLLIGCGDSTTNKPQAVKKPSPVPTSKPAATQPVQAAAKATQAPVALTDDLTAKIKSTSSIIDFFLITEKPEVKNSTLPPEIKKIISDQQNKLMPPDEKIKPFNEEIALVAFDFRRIDANNAQVCFLMKALKDVKGDYVIHLHAQVDKVFKQMLSPGRENFSFENWQSGILPKTTTWKANDMHLVSMKVPAKSIPYNLKINLIEKDTKKNSPLEMGWYKE